MKRQISVLLIMIMLFSIINSITGCNFMEPKTIQVVTKVTIAPADYGPNYRPDLVKADQTYLPGVMYIAYEGYKYNGVDYKKAMLVLHNMGVKCIRNTMFNIDCFPTPTTENKEAIKLMHDILAEAAKYDIRVIGQTSGIYYGNGFNKRDMSENSTYLKWFDMYEDCFYRQVKEFKEVTYWEIGNEPNCTGMYADGGTYTLKEKAAIYTDALLYASRGIHRANPNAVTVLGGLGEFSGLSACKSKQFLELLYDNIFSGQWPSTYPDDYFQVAAWHPYTFYNFNRKEFVKYNNETYDVIKKREGKDKKVLFTEFGFSDGMVKQSEIAAWMPEVFKTIREEMPYVESLCYFREFNDINDLDWGADTSLTMYGLFYDPNPDHNDVLDGKKVIPGAPKPAAYAFQKAAGGSGDLTVMVPDQYRSQLPQNTESK